ncbi:MAG: CaiB/BaiF CoA-transferase family protein [Acidimicrobiales bacterium]|nr:CaiB/BaiF CoA-transferase family protein [Acidimicrobiales bacterium]
MLLDGIRILDLSWHGPGSIATWLLAELGADVVKVEPADGTDFVRTFGLQVDGTTVAQLAFDRGKRSLAVDLRSPDGAAAVRAVAATCHAVIDGFRPGVAARLGIGSEVLRSTNPAITYCRVTGFGDTDPAAGRAGHDLNYVAETGMLSLLPWSRDPMPLPVQVADYVAAPLAALAVVAGVLGARATGVGRDLETSLFDSATFASVLPLSEALMTDRRSPEGGHLLAGGLACYDSYRCADGRWLTVAALEGHFWARFVELIGAPASCVNEQYVPERQTAIRTAVAARIGECPVAEWLATFAGEDVCVAPVLDLQQAIDHHLTGARERLCDVPVPGSARSVPGLRSPVIVTDGRPSGASPPGLGEHSRAVLADAGLSDAAISGLVERGIVIDREQRD